jgi:glucosylceramidase
MWNLALDEKRGPHLGGCGNCRGVVTVDSKTGSYKREVDYYALGQASKFVQPGAHSIGSSGGDSRLVHVAFLNPDGGKVLLVLNAAQGAQVFAVRAAGSSFAFTLPAASVVTFIWR